MRRTSVLRRCLGLPAALLLASPLALQGQEKGGWSFSREGNFAIVRGTSDFEWNGKAFPVVVATTVVLHSLSSSSYVIQVPTGAERERGVVLSFYRRKGKGSEELKTVRLDFNTVTPEVCEAMISRDKPQKNLSVDDMDVLATESDTLVVAFIFKGRLETVSFAIGSLRAQLEQLRRMRTLDLSLSTGP